MESKHILIIFVCSTFVAAAEENGRPFRFEPFPPSTGSLETFVPQGRGKEENVTLYTAATFPNPFTEPEKCTFSARQSHSWFCDPEKLLSPQEQAELEVTLLKARDERAHTCADGQTHHFQIAVTVMPSLLVPEGKSLQEASDDMAYQLLRQWGIGNKACHDGLVLMFVKNHLIVSLAGRENVVPGYISPVHLRRTAQLLEAHACMHWLVSVCIIPFQLFVSFLRAKLSFIYLTSGSVGNTLLSGVELVSSQLPRASTGLGWVTFLLLCLVLAYIISVVVVYFVLSYTLGKRFEGGD